MKRGAAPKTVHVYASAIQSFGKFKGVDISLKYVKMPSVLSYYNKKWQSTVKG